MAVESEMWAFVMKTLTFCSNIETAVTNTRHRQTAPAVGRTAIDWLGHDAHGANVLATANQMLAMEKAARRLMPPALGKTCHVAKLDRQQLTLVVPGAAHASRLRQFTPRILAGLAASGWNLNEIIVKIQADISRSETIPRPGKQANPLGQPGLLAFSVLREQLPEGPLADAISRLLERHGNTPS